MKRLIYLVVGGLITLIFMELPFPDSPPASTIVALLYIIIWLGLIQLLRTKTVLR